MRFPAPILLLFCGLLQSLSGEVTLIDEDFNAAVNSTYGIAGTVLWAKNSGARVNLVDGALLLAGSSTSTVQTQALVRFDAASLVPGEVLSLTFNFSANSLASGAFRVGLFDSRNTPIPSAGTVGVDALVRDTDVGYLGWSGYVLQISPGGQGPSTATRFFSRIEDAVIPSGGNIGKAVLLTNIGTTYYSPLGGNEAVAYLPSSGTAQIKISRISDTEVGLDLSIVDNPLYSVVLTSATMGDLSFDTLGFHLQGGGSNDGHWTIDNVTMTIARIPEPGSPIPHLRAGTELFVDDVRIASRTNVVRTIHPARRRDAPVLAGEGGTAARINGVVHWDPEAGQFRMWYGRSYAVSPDGLNWEKPLFNIYPSSGQPTNIVLAKGGGGVLVDEAEPDPAKRYKALLAETVSLGGFSGYYSADGINWERYGDDRLVTVGSEIGQVIRDPSTRRYFAYVRPYPPKLNPNNNNQKRLGAVLTSDDFVNWSAMSVVLEPDAIDDAWVENPEQRTEFYAMNGFPYGGSYLGIVPLFRVTAIIENPASGQSPYDGPMEGQLITSRDGLAWSRMENRSPIIPSGTGFDQSVMNVANLPLIVGDEIWHYYTAINGTHGIPDPPKSITIALARWRLDGFVSLDAGETEGWVETTLLDPGKATGLEVNADAAGGSLRVEVLDASGQPLPGYSVDDTVVLGSDSVRHVALWRETDRLPAQPFRLRFRYRNASLFSYTLRDPIETWRVRHFASHEATGPAADLADPDRDGLVNLLEYALGTDPLVTQVLLPAATLADGQWTFTYARPADRTDLTYTVEISTDLQGWTTEGVTHGQVSVDNGIAVWQGHLPQAADTNLFFRLLVSIPEDQP